MPTVSLLNSGIVNLYQLVTIMAYSACQQNMRLGITLVNISLPKSFLSASRLENSCSIHSSHVGTLGLPIGIYGEAGGAGH